jgi:hypothetical protein
VEIRGQDKLAIEISGKKCYMANAWNRNISSIERKVEFIVENPVIVNKVNMDNCEYEWYTSIIVKI